MKEAPLTLESNNEEKPIEIKGLIRKYLRFWPWFLLCLLLFVGLGILYLRYAPTIYKSTAKVKIVDDTKELDMATDAFSLLGGGSQINMDNEAQVLKSYRILNQVVEELNLGVRYEVKGNIKTTPIWNPQFKVVKNIEEDKLAIPKKYTFNILESHISIVDAQERTRTISYSQLDSTLSGLPFKIQLQPGADFESFSHTSFDVVLGTNKDAILKLEEDLQIQPTSKTSDIISLSLKGENKDRSEAIINVLIDKFNQDGILDRQQVSRRTIDFIDDRFLYLSTELDSIEGGKQNFKQQNNLSYIEADAGISLERKSATEQDVSNLETQISLSNLLKKSVTGQAAYELLPANVGLQNPGLNALVVTYNDLILRRSKMLESVGEQHPNLVGLSTQLQAAKVNIIKTISVYQTQLRTTLRQASREQNKINAVFSRLPEKEKMLRSIERQQSIKENLFLLLLQKREEAAINFAVTAPSIKVVEFGRTSNRPASPNKLVILSLAGILGLFLPFAILYTKFSLNSKIENRQDITEGARAIPFLAEIPNLRGETEFKDINDRSVLAESFRILATNLNYMLPRSKSKDAKVIYVTSSVSEEGKSLISYNLSVAYASMNKKVLLVGADLRNPQLHTKFGKKLNSKGLTDYLVDPSNDWKDYIISGFENNTNHQVYLSGAIPPNAPQLLSGETFENFIQSAKEEYDVVIVDTAPTVPVTDTFLIADYADVTLYVTRAGFSEKYMLQDVNDFYQKDRLKNMAFVLNDVKFSGKAAYKYGYNAKK